MSVLEARIFLSPSFVLFSMPLKNRPQSNHLAADGDAYRESCPIKKSFARNS